MYAGKINAHTQHSKQNMMGMQRHCENFPSIVAHMKRKLISCLKPQTMLIRAQLVQSAIRHHSSAMPKSSRGSLSHEHTEEKQQAHISAHEFHTGLINNR